MDEFYLPEDLVEWIGLKKSEYLSRLIQNAPENDLNFESYHEYDRLIHSTLSIPDWSIEFNEDGQRVKIYCRSHSEKEIFYQIIIGVIILDQTESEVLVPVLTYVTRFESMTRLFNGGKPQRPPLN
jgi:hypothetical protein